VELKEYKFQTYPNGSYRYSFALSDGQAKEESGDFETVEGEQVLLVVGSFRYIIDNIQYITKYTSDRKGDFK
jgi:hypothetical protein